jgi:C-5 cytosine-specific DNA methylase
MPLAIDLFCGLGGWTEGLLAEGYDVVGFDIECHQYGEHRYPAQLVVQDILTLHGSQFKDAALIVASPPCQEYSYMAMPWTLAKAKAAAIRADTTGRELERLNRLFNACLRLQLEASVAAGHHVPMVIENVKGAQPWVGRARWNFGSFYLWGDVPALMPQAIKNLKIQSPHYLWLRDPGRANGKYAASKNNGGGSWFNIGSPGQKMLSNNPVHALSGVKGSDGYERDHQNAFGWAKPRTGSGSEARKAASALIAKIPLPLSRHIAAVYAS